MPLSGRYIGVETHPVRGRGFLDLRVDVDPRPAHVDPFRCVSADLFERQRSNPLAPVYVHSWRVDDVGVTAAGEVTTLRGRGRVLPSLEPSLEILITITRSDCLAASVTLTASGATTRFECAFESPELRSVELQLDTCETAKALHDTRYDTASHEVRPDNLIPRTLSLKDAWAEAGVLVSDIPGATIDDQLSMLWTNDELHALMTDRFRDAFSRVPVWSVWALAAGRHAEEGFLGIMFDRRAPHRQGFAVFQRQERFVLLKTNPAAEPGVEPPSQDEIAARRLYLFTWVHEMGHSFNLRHSFLKKRADSPSWMNQEDRFTGGGSLWEHFNFSFDREELDHIRHGDRQEVIMGGVDLGVGNHLEAQGWMDMPASPAAPLGLQLTGPSTLELMAPVTIQVALYNGDTKSTVVDASLQPERGNAFFLIRRDRGPVVPYEPMVSALVLPSFVNLQPTIDQAHVEQINLEYGKGGFYFRLAGRYEIRAAYVHRSLGVVLSNVHVLTIANPLSTGGVAPRDFFQDPVGEMLYLRGGQSPSLRGAFLMVRDMAVRLGGTPLGASLAAALVDGIARPFHAVVDGRVTRVKESNFREAVDFTNASAQFLAQNAGAVPNVTHASLSQKRAGYFEALKQPQEAHRELERAIPVLRDRGLKGKILDDLSRYRDSLPM